MDDHEPEPLSAGQKELLVLFSIIAFILSLPFLFCLGSVLHWDYYAGYLSDPQARGVIHRVSGYDGPLEDGGGFETLPSFNGDSITHAMARVPPDHVDSFRAAVDRQAADRGLAPGEGVGVPWPRSKAPRSWNDGVRRPGLRGRWLDDWNWIGLDPATGDVFVLDIDT